MPRNRPKMIHGPLSKEHCLALGTMGGYPLPTTLAELDARLATETKPDVRAALQASRDYIVSLGYTYWTAEDSCDTTFGRQRRQPRAPIAAHTTTNHFPERPIGPDELQWTAKRRAEQIRCWPPHLVESFNEWAANYEFEANMTRENAERLAFAETRRKLGYR
jgi:hypothetical protein